MITGSINHCQPQLILSYLFLFCSIQVSRNIWQLSSLGRAKDQTVLLFIDSRAPPAQPQSLWVPAAQAQLQPGAAVLLFGAFWVFWGSFLTGKLRRTLIHSVLKLHGNSAVKCWSENTQVSNPKSGQNNEIVVAALTLCVPFISGGKGWRG